MKARWIRGTLWFAGIGCLFLPVCGEPPLWSGAYVQDVGTDRATVAMITSAPAKLQLEVAADSGGDPIRFGPSPATRRHAFPVTDLRPGSGYAFRVLDESGAEIDTGRIGTAPADDAAPVRFSVVGDTGGMPWWVWLQRSPLFHLPARWAWLPPRSGVGKVGAAMATAEPDFWLHVGDVIYPRGQHRHYNAGLFRPFADVLRRAPIYAVLGNHDVMEDDGRQMLANLVLPTNDLTGDERMFSFAWGGVRVVALDLNRRAEADLLALQYLRRELAVATEPWFVVMTHYPIYSASRQGDRQDLIEHLMPVLQKHCVDLYVSGHDHNYQRFSATNDLTLVISGGGGKDLYPLKEHGHLEAAREEFTYCMVEVRGNEMKLTANGVDSGEFDSLVIDRQRQGPKLERVKVVNPARYERIQALLR